MATFKAKTFCRVVRLGVDPNFSSDFAANAEAARAELVERANSYLASEAGEDDWKISERTTQLQTDSGSLPMLLFETTVIIGG